MIYRRERQSRRGRGRLARSQRPLLHPNLAKYYHEEIAALHDQLGNEETRALAADQLRMLVNRIDLIPDGAELVIVLRGDLAAILTFASGKRKPEFLNERAILDELLGRARTVIPPPINGLQK